jgi:hypothetical protein
MKALIVTIVTALCVAGTAAAATPKKWYWTQSRAETTVLQKVGIPECWVWPDNRCDNPPGPYWANGGARIKPRTADCSGTDEYQSSFKFNRFTCKIVVTDYYGTPAARGTIALYPTGATTFRWKLLD